METMIKSFDELIEYFERPEVSFDEIKHITCEGLKVIFLDNYTKEEAIQELKAYWEKWSKTKGEKPIFIGLGSLDVE